MNPFRQPSESEEDFEEMIQRDSQHERMTMENIRLTNGDETFMLGSILEDERGAVHGMDSRGSGYTRCDFSDCDHDQYNARPSDAAIWHDDEHTETLWEVK